MTATAAGRRGHLRRSPPMRRLRSRNTPSHAGAMDAVHQVNRDTRGGNRCFTTKHAPSMTGTVLFTAATPSPPRQNRPAGRPMAGPAMDGRWCCAASRPALLTASHRGATPTRSSSSAAIVATIPTWITGTPQLSSSRSAGPTRSWQASPHMSGMCGITGGRRPPDRVALGPGERPSLSRQPDPLAAGLRTSRGPLVRALPNDSPPPPPRAASTSVTLAPQGHNPAEFVR